MKKCLLSLLVVSMLTVSLSAAPGDTLIGKNKAIWQIATFEDSAAPEPKFPTGIMAVILANMDSLPVSYVANAEIEEWVAWTRIMMIQAFPSVVFPKEVYIELVYAVEFYQYGTPRIASYRAAPTCTAGGGYIECDEDPTGADRTPVLWRQVNGDFVEQDPDGVAPYTVERVAGTWTIAPLPAIGNLIVAWDDDFQSFPTFQLTVSAP